MAHKITLSIHFIIILLITQITCVTNQKETDTINDEVTQAKSERKVASNPIFNKSPLYYYKKSKEKHFTVQIVNKKVPEDIHIENQNILVLTKYSIIRKVDKFKRKRDILMRDAEFKIAERQIKILYIIQKIYDIKLMNSKKQTDQKFDIDFLWRWKVYYENQLNPKKNKLTKKKSKNFDDTRERNEYLNERISYFKNRAENVYKNLKKNISLANKKISELKDNISTFKSQILKQKFSLKFKISKFNELMREKVQGLKIIDQKLKDESLLDKYDNDQMNHEIKRAEIRNPNMKLLPFIDYQLHDFKKHKNTL